MSVSRQEFFSYELAPERIAQRPVYPYHGAKLLVVERASGRLTDSIFSSITEFLRPDDLLVFNNSKVIPSRLFGRFAEGGGQLEVLVLGPERTAGLFRAMGKPLKKFKPGTMLEFGKALRARVIERCSEYEVLLEFSAQHGNLELKMQIEREACMPIPPYIRGGHADRQDLADYQSCFAAVEGSIAAPTAGLHFTPELMQKISALGCQIEFVTLHIGQASFLPLQIDERSGQPAPPLPEDYVPSRELEQKILTARSSARRIIAVGTTVVRALESMAQDEPSSGKTSLFIRPPYKFLWVDALVTNFHQPGSTHLALVEALLGSELLERTYQHALGGEYRFLSYGDGMLLF